MKSMADLINRKHDDQLLILTLRPWLVSTESRRSMIQTCFSVQSSMTELYSECYPRQYHHHHLPRYTTLGIYLYWRLCFYHISDLNESLKHARNILKWIIYINYYIEVKQTDKLLIVKYRLSWVSLHLPTESSLMPSENTRPSKEMYDTRPNMSKNWKTNDF